MMTPYLKPCAHCGWDQIEIRYGREAARSAEYYPDKEASVRCQRCGIGTRRRSRAEIAVRQWNRRGGVWDE